MESGKQPSLDQLRTFLAVYRSGSFREAAQDLGTSQPTVTHHITHLEAWYEAELFVRGPRGATPTLTANSLAEALGGPLDQISQCLSKPGSSGVKRLHTVRIGGPSDFVALVLVPALEGLGGHMPPLEFRFGTFSRRLEDLEAGRLDIAVTALRPHHPELESWELMEEEHWLVASPTLAPAGAADDLATLASLPLLSYDGDSSFVRRYWQSVFGTDPRLDVALVLPDLRALRNAALAGLGITVLPRYLVADDVVTGRLTRLNRLAKPPLATRFMTVHIANLSRRADVAGMVKLLLATVRDGRRPQFS